VQELGQERRLARQRLADVAVQAPGGEFRKDFQQRAAEEGGRNSLIAFSLSFSGELSRILHLRPGP
jgi:hypothetical protein